MAGGAMIADKAVNDSLGFAANLSQFAGGLGGLLSAGSAPTGVDFEMIDEMLKRQPLGNDEVLGYLSAQTLYELGAPIQVIEDELLRRNLSNNYSAQQARNQLRQIERVRTLITTGDPKDRREAERLMNKINRKISNGGAQVAIDANGQLQINFTGSESQMISQLRDRQSQSQMIFDNRMKAVEELTRGLGGIKVPTAEDIAMREQEAAQYLGSYLDENLATETERITAQANKLGYSPGRQLADLEETIGDERFRIARGGALERALALVNAQTAAAGAGIDTIQRGLQPSLSAALQGAANTSSQTGLSALQLGLNLAIADTQAQAARSAGLANAWQDFGTGMSNSFLQAGAMRSGGGGGGGVLSSSSLQSLLGMIGGSGGG